VRGGTGDRILEPPVSAVWARTILRRPSTTP